MSEAITWTIRFDSYFMDRVYNLLSGLVRDGRQPKSDINNYIRVETKIRDQILNFLEKIDYVDVQYGRSTKYDISSNGRRYYHAFKNPNEDENKLFHSSLYSNIIHYQYAYDYIINNQFYHFTKKDLFENLVVESTNDFGTRLYDWGSAMNVLGFMGSLNVITIINDEYSLNDEYRTKFNEEIFINLINKRLKSKSEETKILCEYLVSNSYKFLSNIESPSIEYIYHQLLSLYDLNIISFSPGIPKPPIPSNHTVIELKK
jgi:hypothetical protein